MGQAFARANCRPFKKVLDHANAMVVIVGFALTAYLAMNGHEIIAITISLPLSTIIAMLVGNHLLG